MKSCSRFQLVMLVLLAAGAVGIVVHLLYPREGFVGVTYQGNQLPLATEAKPPSPGGDTSRFQFGEAACSPQCCKSSPFSCSHGCICLAANGAVVPQQP